VVDLAEPNSQAVQCDKLHHKKLSLLNTEASSVLAKAWGTLQGDCFVIHIIMGARLGLLLFALKFVLKISDSFWGIS